MKRSEFLKRLGLGAVAAVAAPALLGKENELHEVEPVCKDSVGEAKKLVFWKQDNKAVVPSALMATACVTYTSYSDGIISKEEYEKL